MIEVVPKRKLYLLSGRSHLQLSEDIASHLKVELSLPNLVDFANGEIRPRFQESVRGADVFIFQSHCRTPGRSVN
ncbi:MAG: ribose-phosphate pyrophosphokinae, partial [Acidimicrobiaceae bacterium]|nr:ribose-phosphate pyrophosphokinae [Acidimicrobiaceae bacterium]